MAERKKITSLTDEQKHRLLSSLRKEVDSIDKDLVELIRRRTVRSILIGRIKRSMNQPTYSPEREKEINEKIKQYLKEPLRHEALWRIYERILDQSRAIQREEAEKGEVYNVDIPVRNTGIASYLSPREWKLVAGFFAFCFIFLIYLFFTPSPGSARFPVTFDIRINETAESVINRLEEKGVIATRSLAKAAFVFTGTSTRLRAARYTIDEPLSYLGLTELFTSEKGVPVVSLSFYNGISNNGIGSILSSEKMGEKDSILNFLNSEIVPIDGKKLFTGYRGFLLPGDYYFYRNSSYREIRDSMFFRWKKNLTPEMTARAKELGYSVYELTVLASIIEGETNYKPEMKRVSGVYHNRLKIGMKLQADPTVQFVSPPGTTRITFKELRINSPFNTYMYAGLPPAPINNPGIEALQAAFYPEEHSFLYFVADKNTGKHIFTKSYKDHLKAAKEYQKWYQSLKKQK